MTQTKTVDGYTLKLDNTNSTITVIFESEDVGHFEETAHYMNSLNAIDDFQAINDRSGIIALLDRMW